MLINQHRALGHEAKTSSHKPTFKLQDVLEVRVDQSALNKNLEIIAKALQRITELSNSYQTCEEELNALKQRTGRTERDIHTINKGMELRKQFDLNKIIEAVEEQESRLQKVETSSSQHSNEITKLYDMAKYLDYDHIVRSIDNLQYFARRQDTNEAVGSLSRKLQELSQSKMDVDKCEKELKKMVLQTSYKTFYDDTNRELIRLQREKMSHFEYEKESESVKLMQERMREVDGMFKQLSDKVEENCRVVLSFDVKELEVKIKKSKQDLQYQLNSLKPVLSAKVSATELTSFETDINGKMQSFLASVLDTVAEKNQTKKALIFLERRINLIIKVLNRNSESPQQQEQMDAMLTRTNPWHCASCSAHLAKAPKSQSAFAAWSSFPLRQPIGEKDRNFQAFLDKLALRRLSEPFINKNNSDEKMQMLADAIATVKERDNQDDTGTKTTNMMHTYGRSESRSMVRVRSSKMVPLSDPRQRKSQAKRSHKGDVN